MEILLIVFQINLRNYNGLETMMYSLPHIAGGPRVHAGLDIVSGLITVEPVMNTAADVLHCDGIVNVPPLVFELIQEHAYVGVARLGVTDYVVVFFHHKGVAGTWVCRVHPTLNHSRLSRLHVGLSEFLKVDQVLAKQVEPHICVNCAFQRRARIAFPKFVRII